MTESSAKGVCTRMNKSALANGKPATYKIMDRKEYDARPVKMVERINLMSGVPFMEAEGTPGFCSPASEAYWSM